MKPQTILNSLYQHIKNTDVLLNYTHVYYYDDIMSCIHITYNTDYMLSEFIVWDTFCYLMNVIDLVKDSHVVSENKGFKGLHTVIKKFDEDRCYINKLSSYQYLKPVKITWHQNLLADIKIKSNNHHILYSQYNTEMTTWSLVYYFDKTPNYQSVISYGKVMFLMPNAPHELLKSGMIFKFINAERVYGICEILDKQ